MGGLARAVAAGSATARELPAEHRRDGAAFGVLALGVVWAVAMWFDAAGPVGRALTALVRLGLGNGAALVPVVLVVAAVHMLRQAPRPETRGRVAIGVVAVGLSVWACCTSTAGRPLSAAGRSHAGGELGWAVAAPLEDGLSAVLAVLVLFLLGAFGALVLTATPLRALAAARVDRTGCGAGSGAREQSGAAPGRARGGRRRLAVHRTGALPRLRGRADRTPRGRPGRARPLGPGRHADPFADRPGVRGRPSRCASEKPRPTADPAKSSRARRAGAPPIERPLQLELAGGGGMYTLPGPDCWPRARRTWSTPGPTTRSSPR